jgi:hypothetical protein
MRSLYIVLFLALIGLLNLSACRRNCVRHPGCATRPNSGPCPDASTKWYFDRVDNKCKSFTYGGCGGVVPFESKEDCMKSCKCQN